MPCQWGQLPYVERSIDESPRPTAAVVMAPMSVKSEEQALSSAADAGAILPGVSAEPAVRDAHDGVAIVVVSKADKLALHLSVVRACHVS